MVKVIYFALQVWDACSDAILTFNKEDLLEDLAFIVENDVILNGIYHQLDKITDRVEVRYESRGKDYNLPSQTTSENQGSPFSQVTLENGEVIDTRLLVNITKFMYDIFYF